MNIEKTETLSTPLATAVQTEFESLMEENRKLKALCRYQYLTLGYYATPFNYASKNITYHPLTGKAASGILHDAGHDARYAMKIAVELLGFTPKEICDEWGGVFHGLTDKEQREFSNKHWVCDTPCSCNDLKEKV